MNKKAVKCAGCRDDFYNGNNSLGITECWLLKSARIATRYEIASDREPTVKFAFRKVEIYNCYTKKGYVHYTKLPNFVKTVDVL